MRYVMKQKLFGWGDDFYIKNEAGVNLFFVDGKALSIRNQLAFKDMEGNELAFIQQKLLSISPTYEIYRSGKLFAVVKKDFFEFFRCSFTVDIPGPNDLRAEGNLFDREYAFKRGEEVVAQVSKHWFSWSDSYGVDVAPGEDDILILASTVVIDMACHDKEH
jgi:uncharacterized protein YxjI